jgi:hypothetical protein
MDLFEQVVQVTLVKRFPVCLFGDGITWLLHSLHVKAFALYTLYANEKILALSPMRDRTSVNITDTDQSQDLHKEMRQEYM